MLLILTACSTTPVVTEAPNDFTLTTRDVYYDIAGPRASDIAQQLDDHSRNNGGRLAETRWKLKSKLRFGPRDSGCIMETADIAVDIETELPRWQGAIRAPDALRAQWQKFEAAARTHERGHYDHGISAAHEVTAALKGLTAASCDALGKAATAKTQAVVSKYEAIDTQYDADTRHGILQGTVWNYASPSPCPSPRYAGRGDAACAGFHASISFHRRPWPRNPSSAAVLSTPA